MNKANLGFIILAFVLAILISGCETTRCIVKGTGYTAEGVTKDVKNFVQGIIKGDAWVRENIW